MLSRTFRPLLLAFAFLPLLVAAGETEDPLAMFDPLVGKTWKGEGTAGEVAGKTDIMSWQRIMGGEAVQQTQASTAG